MLGVNIVETQLSGSLLKTMSDWQEILSFFYVSRLMLLLLPTTLLLPILLLLKRKKFGRPDESDRLLIYVITATLTVFTLAGHYRPHYMLPLMPLTVLLLASSADTVTVDHLPEKMWQVFFWSGAFALAVFPVLLISERHYAAGILLAGTGAILVYLLRVELGERVWRDHPLSAKLMTCCLLATLIFSGFNAYSYRGNRFGDRDFSFSVGKILHANDMLLALGSYPNVLPYYSNHPVVPVNGLAELKERVAIKAAGQELYVLVEQEDMAALNAMAETSELLVLGGKKNGKKIIFAKILDLRR